MFASHDRPRGARRGVVLILILGMLGLMALIGVTFATFAAQQRASARDFAYGFQDLDPESLMDFALSQLINDTDNPLSAVRGHSLGRDMYGNDSVMANGFNNAAIKCYLPYLPNGQPLQFLAVQQIPAANYLGGFYQFATNIPADKSVPATYGWDFTRWVLRMSSPAVGGTSGAYPRVDQTFEVIADDYFNNSGIGYQTINGVSTLVHVLTLSFGSDASIVNNYYTTESANYPGFSTGAAPNAVPAPAAPGSYPLALPAPRTIKLAPAVEDQTTGSQNTIGTALLNNAAGSYFTLDGRYLHAFNGPGIGVLSRPWLNGTTVVDELVAGMYPNFRLNGRILGQSTVSGGNFVPAGGSSGLGLANRPYIDPSTVAALGYPDAIPSAGNVTPGNTFFNGMDEDYDACDLENWFLALQSADGKVMIPSFHRPGIIRVDTTPVGNAQHSGFNDWTSLDPRSASRFLRPRLVDHPQSNLYDLTPDPITGQVKYDVDNDGDGQTDSVWLDLGYPPQRDPTGRLFKPLFAFMVLGLNGRMPLNTVGNLQGRDQATYWAGSTAYPAAPFVAGAPKMGATPATSPTPLPGSAGGFILPANMPTNDHASSPTGYSPSQVNPKYALQNFADATAAVPYGSTSYSQVDNSGVPVWLTQLRNLLAGTRPQANPLHPEPLKNGDYNYVAVNNTPYYMPNGILDPNDSTSGASAFPMVARSTNAVAGRWGEQDAIPVQLLSPFHVISTKVALYPTFARMTPYPAPYTVAGTSYSVGTLADYSHAGTTPYNPQPPVIGYPGTAPVIPNVHVDTGNGTATTVAMNSPLNYLYYNNPVRPGRSNNLYTTLPDYFDQSDDNFTAVDPWPIAAPAGIAAGAGTVTHPENYSFLDDSGSMPFASERMRFFVTPVDLGGVGKVVGYDAPPTIYNPYGNGPETFGRVNFFRYFRPPGLPGQMTFPFTTAGGVTTAITNQSQAPDYRFTWIAPPGTAVDNIPPKSPSVGYRPTAENPYPAAPVYYDNTGTAPTQAGIQLNHNRLHGYEGWAWPRSNNFYSAAEALTFSNPSGAASNSGIPFDTYHSSAGVILPVFDIPGPPPIRITNPGNGMLGALPYYPTIYLTPMPAQNAINTNRGQPYAPINSSPTLYDSLAPYLSGANNIGHKVVNGLPGGSLGRDEADEMYLYGPSQFDAPFGASDLEWLYRKQDLDGAQLTSRLQDLAPISFLNPLDGTTRRRMFSVDSMELNSAVWAYDNPVHDTTRVVANPPAFGPPSLNYNFGGFKYRDSSYDTTGADNLFTHFKVPAPSTGGSNGIDNARFYNGISANRGNLGVIDAMDNAAANPYATPFLYLNSPLAQRARKINLNYPLPISNNYAEPVRLKWIGEAYQTMKLVLPPAAVDTPEELAALSQFLVNVIDFRDTDATCTQFINPDVSFAYQYKTPGVPPHLVAGIHTNSTTVAPTAGTVVYSSCVQYGMEYNPIALNEVMAYRFMSGTTPAQVTRMFVEMVNTLMDPEGPNNNCDLDLKDWNFVFLPENPSTAEMSADASTAPPGRPNPINGQLPFNVLMPDAPAKPTGAALADPVLGPFYDLDSAYFAPVAYNPSYNPTVTTLPSPSFTSLDYQNYLSLGLKAAYQYTKTKPGGGTGTVSQNSPNPIPALQSGVTAGSRADNNALYYYVIGTPMPPSVTNLTDIETNPIPSGTGGVTGASADVTKTDQADAVLHKILNDYLNNKVKSQPGTVRFFWLYLTRPANPFDRTSPQVVVDSIRIPFSELSGTTIDSSTPFNTVQRLQPYRGGQLVDPYNPVASMTPYRPLDAYGYSEQTSPGVYGGTGAATGAPTPMPMTPPVTYSQSHLPSGTYTKSWPRATQPQIRPGGTSPSSSYPIYNTIGGPNVPFDDNWDYLPFQDRDFSSVAELMLVPGCPPGLFTKKFVEFPPPVVRAGKAYTDSSTASTAVGTAAAPFAPNALPTTTYGTTAYQAWGTATTTPSLQYPDVGVPFLTSNVAADTTSIYNSSTTMTNKLSGSTPNKLTNQVIPHSFPYLVDKFFYTAAPGTAIEQTNATGTEVVAQAFNHAQANSLNGNVDGYTSAGWHKMLEFFEVPSPAIGAIGQVTQGVNFDWARQDLRPGLINLNLVIDQEVFLGLMDDPRLDLSTATLAFAPQVVNQVAPLIYDSAYSTSPVMVGNGFPNATLGTAATNPFTERGFFYPNDDDLDGDGQTDQGHPFIKGYSDITSGAGTRTTGLTPAFSDFLKLRHGGSGFLFAFGTGPVGSGTAGQTTFTIPANSVTNEAVAADRPFRSMSHPDINATVLRPATLPPGPQIIAGGATHNFTNPPEHRVQPVDASVFNINTIPGYYASDPGIKNPYLSPSYKPGVAIPTTANPLNLASPNMAATTTAPLTAASGDIIGTYPTKAILQPPPIPARRLFSVPDAATPPAITSDGASNDPNIKFGIQAGNFLYPPIYNSNAAPGDPTNDTLPAATPPVIPGVYSDRGTPEYNLPITHLGLSNRRASLFPKDDLFNGTGGTPHVNNTPNSDYLGAINSGDLVVGSTAVDTMSHPYFRTEMLQRVMNLTTVRTHQFAVWITVGFFEVIKVGDPYFVIPSGPNQGTKIPQVDVLGPEIGLLAGTNSRYRSFFLLDRTKLVGFNTSNPPDFRDVVTFRRRIE